MVKVYDKGEHTHDATGDGVGAFDGEGEGGSVDAIGARVGLFVGELVGGSVTIVFTGDVVGVTVTVFVGERVGVADAATGQNA
mmetsp:Transcript_4396/g.7580  ORF Transcript_4396/g.7580 Transcript_4396/m.7580 type:complete len:83 (-) Transcript_4396:582-830(-)